MRNVKSHVAAGPLSCHRTHVERGTFGALASIALGRTFDVLYGVIGVVMLRPQFDSVWNRASSLVGDVCSESVTLPAPSVTSRTSTQNTMSWNELNPIQ